MKARVRWSIRTQILVPLVAIQAAAVTFITLATAALAAQRTGQEIVERLNGVIGALQHASFPYTAGVLSKMQGLSGAQFVALDAAGRPTASTFSAQAETLSTLRSLPLTTRIEALGSARKVFVGSAVYFAVSLSATGNPSGGSLLVLYPETSWRRARWEAALWPLVLGAASLVLITATTSLIARSISSRIGRVEQQVARIADGDFRELETGPRHDEVQDLARSINRMCAQLREMQSTARRSERTRLLAQLAAGLAHQLRNALTGARLSVQLHARRCAAAESDQSLDVALRQLALTEEQVKGLLSLGRVEKREPVWCDLSELVREVGLLVDPTCRHAGVTFEEGDGSDPVEVLADEPSLRAAVLNLTLNAIEACGRGGHVRLEPKMESGRATVVVSDTGPGPPPELAATLLDPFTSSKPEGVGLGLTLAHQVALDHGGELVWSRAGGTTRFALRLSTAAKVAKVPT